MQYPEPASNVLPEDFDGVFRFTNWSDEEFIGRWGGMDYVYPPKQTLPMIIPTESPLQIQSIRKKFARELAMREFYKSDRYDELNGLTEKSRGTPVIFNEKELEPLVQKCLVPLQPGKAKAYRVPKEEVTVSDHTKIVEDKNFGGKQSDSLVGAGTVIAEV